MLKQNAIKYSAENATEVQADKLVQETMGATKKPKQKEFLKKEKI